MLFITESILNVQKLILAFSMTLLTRLASKIPTKSNVLQPSFFCRLHRESSFGPTLRDWIAWPPEVLHRSLSLWNTRTLMCKCSLECDKELNSNSYRFFYLGPELWLKLSCGICKISPCELTELFNNFRVSTVTSPSEQAEEIRFLSVAAYSTRRFSV